MLIYVDIDETICITPEDRNYEKSMPIYERIEKINKLYEQGHKIVYWTARGTVTGIDWTETTKKQLKRWDAKHHDIKLGKPHFDLYICDKSINSEKYFRNNKGEKNEII